MKNNIRRIISLLLIVSILLPANLAFASSTTNSSTVLEDLGIAKVVKFPYFHLNYDRIEFAAMMYRLSNFGADAPEKPSTVNGVTDKDAAYAEFALSRNLLKLDSNGNFNPNQPVGYSDAVVALLTLVGYDAVAEAMGGTLADYMSLAVSTDLTHGVPASSDDTISKEDLAKMILNAMEIVPPEVSIAGVVSSGPSFFEKMEIVRGEARILATDRIGFGAPVCREGYVNLDGKIIKTQKTIDDSLVGRYVYYYVREDAIMQTLLSVEDISGETLVIAPEDIYDVNFGDKELTFRHADDKKVKIPYTAEMVVNGKPADITQELFEVFETGKLEIFDSDNNGSFDSVYITVCVTEVVESASVASKIINTQYTNRRIDLGNDANTVVVYENGTPSSMEAVKNGTVVSIACDAYTIDDTGKLVFDYANARHTAIYVSNRAVTGMLEYASDTEYKIDGRSFVPNSLLFTIAASGEKNPLDTASVYKFLIDAFGTIADYQVSDDSGEMQYGYLMDTAVVQNGFNISMKVQILNNNSELVIYSVKERYTLDGDRQDVELGYTLPVVLANRQLIRYRIADGAVAEIDTINVGSTEVAETSLSLDFSAKDTALRYWADFNGFEDHRTVVSSDTKVFYVTDDPTADENAFRAQSASVFASSESYNYESYDIGDMGKTGCILVYKQVSDSIGYQNRAYMVEKAIQVLDENDNAVTRLYLHGYGGSITKDLVDESDLIFTDVSEDPIPDISGLKKGDIIRFSENASGKVANIERAFAITKEPTMHIDDLTAGGLHYEYGTLYNTNATHFEAVAKTDLSSVADNEKFVFAYKYPAKIPVYNMIEDTITLVGADFQNIPTYINSAEKVTVFLHMGAYAFYSAAVYIWE